MSARLAGEIAITTVSIPAGSVTLEGALTCPADMRGLVLFAHGSGSSRMSPRNHAVATHLHEARFATLLFDLLTSAEASARRPVFDVRLLTGRLVAATAWARLQPELAPLAFGYFGASTGAAAALGAAAELGSAIAAVVVRGGRIDLATGALPRVTAPTLCIVGARDDAILQVTEPALRELRCPRELVIIPGATHLFEEPGALEEVARLAARWFDRFLGA